MAPINADCVTPILAISFSDANRAEPVPQDGSRIHFDLSRIVTLLAISLCILAFPDFAAAQLGLAEAQFEIVHPRIPATRVVDAQF